jgi:hypothetical protein
LAVVATVLVDCPFSAIVDVLACVFRERHYAGWVVVDDADDDVRRHDAIRIDWCDVHSPLPSFRGRITVRPHFRKSRMRISGTANVPAMFALNEFARDLAAAVELRYLVYLQEIGATGADRHAGRERDQVLGTH